MDNIKRHHDMIPWVCAIGALTGIFILTSLGDLARKEIQGRLGLIPQAVLWLASRWLDPAQRVTLYKETWIPGLRHVLRETESLPITRILRGIKFALRVVVAPRRPARRSVSVPQHPRLTTWVKPGSLNDLIACRAGTPPPLWRARGHEDLGNMRSIRQALLKLAAQAAGWMVASCRYCGLSSLAPGACLSRRGSR